VRASGEKTAGKKNGVGLRCEVGGREARGRALASSTKDKAQPTARKIKGAPGSVENQRRAYLGTESGSRSEATLARYQVGLKSCFVSPPIIPGKPLRKETFKGRSFWGNHLDGEIRRDQIVWVLGGEDSLHPEQLKENRVAIAAWVGEGGGEFIRSI